MPATLYDKLWGSHVVTDLGGGDALFYNDRHLVHEVSSPQAFAGLRQADRRLRRPETHLAIADHAVSTRRHDGRATDPLAVAQVSELAANDAAFDVRYMPLDGPRQGIVHVIGPEFGMTIPGITLVCGNSHTTTHGAFDALAFGIGASECGMVMATQCLRQTRAQTTHVALTGELSAFIRAKDIALAFVAELGARGAVGYAVEYGGAGIATLSMAARMTLCNMTIKAGRRVDRLVAPDDVTFAFVRGRPLAPSAAQWDAAVAGWRRLRSDADATFNHRVAVDLAAIAPQVTWGTSSDDAAPVTGKVPNPRDRPDPGQVAQALAYMDLAPGTRLDTIAIDKAFIGSCTNGRIEDLRAAASVVRGRRVDHRVQAIVVPGSTTTKRQAKAEGLDAVFVAAGFEWRDAGCSMCVAMNDDRLAPGERCASTSNRNFEGRQGQGGRTHLMSPAMVAAAAIACHLVDVRSF